MKKGFTLAEVLVTLGIIGVVAALTTPALIQSVGNSKIPPKLQKVKSTFETAVEMMLNEENANSITGLYGKGVGKRNVMRGAAVRNDIIERLSNYMKLVSISTFEASKVRYKKYSGDDFINGTTTLTYGNRYDMEDGTILYFSNFSKKRTPKDEYANIPNNQKIGYLYVDINGSEPPNREGKDLFKFLIYNDGTLRPYGALNSDRAEDSNDKGYWKDHCSESNVDTEYGLTCTGSIFDNGMKIIYQ